MVAPPLSAKGAPCPDCGRAWADGKHCQPAPAGSVCGVQGCRRRPL